MSVQTGEFDGPSGSTTDAAKEQATNLASNVQEQGSAAAESVQQGSQQVGQAAKAQVGKLNEEAQKQIHGLLVQAQEELGGRAGEQTDKAAANLKGLAQEFHALADGRTDEASRLVPYVRQVGDKASDYAERLETGGFAGVAEDLSSFARRRPGLFLLGALAAGFATARLVRGAQKSSSSSGAPDTELSNPTATGEAPSRLAAGESYKNGFGVSSEPGEGRSENGA